MKPSSVVQFSVLFAGAIAMALFVGWWCGDDELPADGPAPPPAVTSTAPSTHASKVTAPPTTGSRPEPTNATIAGTTSAFRPLTPGELWRSVGVGISSAELLERARASKTLEGWLPALRLLILCAVNPLWDDDFYERTIQTVRAFSPGDEGLMSSQAVLEQARRSLGALCGPFDSEAARAPITLEFRAAVAGQTAPYQRFASHLSIRNVANWPPETRQAAITVLAQPVLYAATLESVLLAVIPTRGGTGGPFGDLESAWVRVQVYRELSGDRQAASVGNLSLCLRLLVCGDAALTGVTPARAEQLRQRLDLVVHAVRTQQWQTLGL